MALHDKTLIFIGAGSMAEAIVCGLIEQKKMRPEQITLLNRGDMAKLERLRRMYGVSGAATDDERRSAVAAADLVVLAMKPKDAASALRMYGPHLHAGQLIISVIAGLSIASLKQLAGPALPVVRAMPNTSSTIGLGATGMSCSSDVSPEERALAREIFESTGVVCEAEEQLLDIITGVSGSGPAYLYYVMEAMIRGGVKGGLDEATARQLTVQTVRGAAEMVLRTGEDPAELRRKVTSPGGTTEAALRLLEEGRVSEQLTAAVLRAAERAAELGRLIAGQLDGNDPDGRTSP